MSDIGTKKIKINALVLSVRPILDRLCVLLSSVQIPRSLNDQYSATGSLICYHEFPRSLFTFATHRSKQVYVPFPSTVHLLDLRSISTTISVDIRKSCLRSDQNSNDMNNPDRHIIDLKARPMRDEERTRTDQRRDNRRAWKEDDDDESSIFPWSALLLNTDAESTRFGKLTIQQLPGQFSKDELPFDRRSSCLLTSIRLLMTTPTNVVPADKISLWQHQFAATIDFPNGALLPLDTGGLQLTSSYQPGLLVCWFRYIGWSGN